MEDSKKKRVCSVTYIVQVASNVLDVDGTFSINPLCRRDGTLSSSIARIPNPDAVEGLTPDPLSVQCGGIRVALLSVTCRGGGRSTGWNDLNFPLNFPLEAFRSFNTPTVTNITLYTTTQARIRGRIILISFRPL